jgi:hypothetical protein
MTEVRKAKINLWAFASALADEFNDDKKLRKFADDHGYTFSYLRKLRSAAEAFPPERRYDGEHNKPNISVLTHLEAGDPDILDALVEGYLTDNRNNKPSINQYIKSIMDHVRKATKNEPIKLLLVLGRRTNH